MKISLRIDYIKEIAQGLSSYEWADIDLILGQFKLPTSSAWNDNDKRGYLNYHLKDTDDETLQELRNYVVGSPPDQEKLIPVFEQKIWLPNKFKLFISHLSKDKTFIAQIKTRLSVYGVDCFVAHEDIDPTLEWQEVIESALHSCDAITAFLTTDFHQSSWTDQEIGFCVARRILIIPLKAGINPYGFIGKYQAQNCLSLTPTQIAEKIFSILIESPLTSAKMAESVVSDFVSSGSWESARARCLLLLKIKSWTPELLRSIENSVEVNSHVAEAWGVPDKIKQIINLHRK